MMATAATDMETAAMAMAMAKAVTAVTAATAMATATATATAMEEEECDGCDGANPQRRLDDSLLCLSDVRLIPATTVGAAARRQWSPATATRSMPVINIGAMFIGWEDQEGNDGSSVATDYDNKADAEVGEYAHNFLGGRPPPTLGGAFWEEEDDNEDDGDEQ